jgi:transposase
MSRCARPEKKLAAAVRASGTSLTGIFGVGPFVAATVIGDVAGVSRFATRDRFAAYNGTAPVEVSSGNRKIYRLSLRGNRRVNHAIHMTAITQIRHAHSGGRTCYDKKIAEGKTHKEALRSLKRRISDAIYARLRADARHTASSANEGPGGQPGNDSDSSAAGSHPDASSSDKPLPDPAPAYGPPPRPAQPCHRNPDQRKSAAALDDDFKEVSIWSAPDS